MTDLWVLSEETEGDQTVLLSPTVGVVHVSKKVGQTLAGGDLLGFMWVLGQRKNLLLAPHMQGTVGRVINEKKWQPLFYREPLAWLLKKHAGTSQKRSMHEVVPGEGEIALQIKAPMDGMFYIRPNPKDAPFVREGDEIASGQTLGLIEVMKCFYPLKYEGDRTAVVKEIKLKETTPVISGKVLFELILKL